MIEKLSQLTAEFTDHLGSVEWGFDAGIRYLISDRQASVETVFKKGIFRALKKDGLIGTVMSLRKPVSLGNGAETHASYISLLSVLASHRGQGHAKQLVEATHADHPEVGFNYAYVEEKNIPSGAVFEALGYKRFGKFLATTFNRLRPAASSRAQLLSFEDTVFIKEKLTSLYHDHALMDLETSFHADDYWVVMDQGRILAGAQIEQEFWSITSMAGIEGWFATHVLPYIPLLNLVLNPKKIPVLKIGNLYIPKGQEEAFMELVSHLTRYYQKKLALAYLDPRSPVYQRLKKTQPFGLFNLFFETPVTLWARFVGLEETAINDLKKRPFVVSPVDIS